MKNNEKSIVWVEDQDGNSHVCFLEPDRQSNFEQLSDEERQSCYNGSIPWS